MTTLLLKILGLVVLGALTALMVAICAMGVSIIVRAINDEWKEGRQ